MADRRPLIADIARPEDHRVVAAWRRVTGTGVDPTAVQLLKDIEKTSAYRLIGCGPDGGNVVATRRPTATTLIERAIYEQVLPHAGIPRLRLYGVIHEAEGASWLFLEDAGEDTPDLRRYDDRVVAGEWLGRLHADLVGIARPGGLPDRDLDDARSDLRSSRAALVATAKLPELVGDGRRLIDDLVQRLDTIEASWDRIVDLVGELPSTVVHADLVAKNMRIREAHEDGSLVTFDWDMAGWGPPLRDLAHIDLGAYLHAARPVWGGRAGDLARLADIGRLLGLIAAIGWEMPRFQLGGRRRALTRLATYHERLGSVAVRVGLMPPGESATHRPSLRDTTVLTRGLPAMEPHGSIRIVDVLERVPNAYQSTYPSHIVRCRLDDGTERRVFVKRFVPGIHAGGPFWVGGPYEACIYRDILAARDLGTPGFFGTWSDPASGDTFLAIEYVEGWRVDQSHMAWVVAAARWLARLHRELSPVALRHPAVRIYDATYFRERSRRALATLRATGADLAWLEVLVRTFDDVMIPRLVGAEPSFIHGEPYPQNMIVEGRRIRTVDWQSAAIGPGAIDLACLTEGRWPASVVAESEAAYVAERWAGDAPPAFREELEAARVYWSMRWLGIDGDTTTAAERSTYVEALRRSAERLGHAAAIG